MKALRKVLLILMISVCMFSIMQNNVFAANDGPSAGEIIGNITPVNPDEKVSSDFASVIGNVLGFLRIASGLVAVVMLAVMGFNYIMSDAQNKADYLKKFAPIIIGFILVFSATTVAKFLIGIAGSAS